MASCINDILLRGKLPVLVGGMGLYIDSLLSGRLFSACGDAGMRLALEAEYDNTGGEAMLEKLSEFDPASAKKLHTNDRKRIIRAIEIYSTSEKTISQHDYETKTMPLRCEAVK